MAIIPRSMRLPTLIGLASAMLLGQPAVSETIGKRLAVLEFKGSGIKDAVLENFGDEVRGGAVAGLVGRGVLVIRLCHPHRTPLLRLASSHDNC